MWRDQPSRQILQRLPSRNSIWARKKWTKNTGKKPKIIFEKTITLFPKYVEALNSLGLAEIQLKDGEGTVKAFRGATQVDPSLPRANLYLGEFYYDNHQYKEAEPYFLRAAADQPQSAQIHTALAYVELQNGKNRSRAHTCS